MFDKINTQFKERKIIQNIINICIQFPYNAFIFQLIVQNKDIETRLDDIFHMHTSINMCCVIISIHNYLHFTRHTFERNTKHQFIL